MLSALSKAQEYYKWDINDGTKQEVESLINYCQRNSKEEEVLAKLFCTRVAFGTAGLRAEMGPGYSRMNDLVILQTSQGLIKYLLEYGSKNNVNVKSKGVIIGYDHRSLKTLSSKRFGRICASVFLSQGFKVYMLENYVPTPFVPFGLTMLGCAAGFMVTASHNPAKDNGFKMYWSNGAQIIPPHDTGIATAIEENLEPWLVYDVDTVMTHQLLEDVTTRVSDSYFQCIQQSPFRPTSQPVETVQCSLNITYTALHGVGYQWVSRAFHSFGHSPVLAVPSQRDPDPHFPTVIFPNPEEKGALNEAMAFAESNNSQLIIANDPDADRLAAAEFQTVKTSIPDLTQSENLTESDKKKARNGSWHVFSGNELGVLLGSWCIRQFQQQSLAQENTNATAAVLASVVSSRMLKRIAATEKIQYFDTLTGFKWIGNKAIELREAKVNVLFSFEEALGYCIGDTIFDKDGISAAVVFVHMAHELSKQKITMLDYYRQLEQKYGTFISYNSYVVCHDASLINTIFHRLRTGDSSSEHAMKVAEAARYKIEPSTTGAVTMETNNYLKSFAGAKVISIKDVTFGYDSNGQNGKLDISTTPDSHMIIYEFEQGVSFILRTSGTEPKIKFYTEIVGGSESRIDLEFRLKQFVDKAVDEMLQCSFHGLKLL